MWLRVNGMYIRLQTFILIMSPRLDIKLGRSWLRWEDSLTCNKSPVAEYLSWLLTTECFLSVIHFLKVWLEAMRFMFSKVYNKTGRVSLGKNCRQSTKTKKNRQSTKTKENRQSTKTEENSKLRAQTGTDPGLLVWWQHADHPTRMNGSWPDLLLCWYLVAKGLLALQ